MENTVEAVRKIIRIIRGSFRKLFNRYEDALEKMNWSIQEDLLSIVEKGSLSKEFCLFLDELSESIFRETDSVIFDL